MDQYQQPVVAEFTSNNLNLLPPETGVSGENEALSPVSSEDSKTIKEISRLSQSLSLDQEEFDPQSVEASYEDDKSTGVFTESSSPDTNQTLIDWQNFHIAHEENNEMENQQKSSGRSRPNSLSLPDLQEQNESTSSRLSNNAHAIQKIEKIKLSNSRGRTQSDVIVIPPTRKVLEDLEAQESLSKSLPQGTILRKGDMIEFIADDLQEKIRRSSPMSKTGSSNSRRSSVRSTASYSSNASAGTSMATSTASGWSRSPSSLFQQSPDDIPPIDPHAIMELENQARKKHSATKEKKKQSPGTKRKIESVEEFRENNDDEMEDKVASKKKDDREVQEDYFEDDGGSDDGDEKTETCNKKRKKDQPKKVKEMAIESIFLGGLDTDTTPITIKKFFKSHGVKLVDIRKKPKKRFGHCDLANNEDLEKAIQLNNAIIDGASIQIAKATGQRPVLSYGIDKSIMSGKRTVVVKNLSFKVTEDELLDLFKDSIAARIPKYTDSGKPRGKGFVDFPDANTARNAVNDMNNSKLHGRRIFVEFAPESGKNSKSERIAQLIKPEVEREEVKTELDAEEY